jgi:hypothetical protein
MSGGKDDIVIAILAGTNKFSAHVGYYWIRMSLRSFPRNGTIKDSGGSL